MENTICALSSFTSAPRALYSVLICSGSYLAISLVSTWKSCIGQWSEGQTSFASLSVMSQIQVQAGSTPSGISVQVSRFPPQNESLTTNTLRILLLGTMAVSHSARGAGDSSSSAIRVCSSHPVASITYWVLDCDGRGIWVQRGALSTTSVVAVVNDEN